TGFSARASFLSDGGFARVRHPELDRNTANSKSTTDNIGFFPRFAIRLPPWPTSPNGRHCPFSPTGFSYVTNPKRERGQQNPSLTFGVGDSRPVRGVPAGSRSFYRKLSLFPTATGRATKRSANGDRTCDFRGPVPVCRPFRGRRV